MTETATAAETAAFQSELTFGGKGECGVTVGEEYEWWWNLKE